MWCGSLETAENLKRVASAGHAMHACGACAVNLQPLMGGRDAFEVVGIYAQGLPCPALFCPRCESRPSRRRGYRSLRAKAQTAIARNAAT
jgi:hypothetical protein